MTLGVHLGIDFHEILDFVIICENHPNAYIQSIWVGSAHSKPHIFQPKLHQKSKYAYAHAADPVSSLRWNPLRHLTFETPFSRFYKVPIPWTQRHPRDPTPPQPPKGPKGTQRARGRGPGAKGPREPKGDQRGSSRSREISENCFCPNHNEMASKTLNFNRF